MDPPPPRPETRENLADVAARARAQTLVGTVVSGRYRIVDLLAMGGVGAVYLAEHVHMQKHVAVKVLHPDSAGLPDLVARFEREAVAGAHVSHPNVAAATDFGELPDGSFFLVLEYVRGTTLREVIRRGPLGAPRAARIARQIAAGLGAAHAMGIVHRDLKPRNVMLIEGERDVVKIIDFGIAKVDVKQVSIVAASRVSTIDERITTSGAVFGTIAYLAPEAALGMDLVDARADFYALGVVLYEMLAGVHPFDISDPVALFKQHAKRPVPPIAERAPGIFVPPPLEAVVRKLLEKAPDARYGTAEQVMEALDGALDVGSPTVPPVQIGEATPVFAGPSLMPPPGLPRDLQAPASVRAARGSTTATESETGTGTGTGTATATPTATTTATATTTTTPTATATTTTTTTATATATTTTTPTATATPTPTTTGTATATATGTPTPTASANEGANTNAAAVVPTLEAVRGGTGRKRWAYVAGVVGVGVAAVAVWRWPAAEGQGARPEAVTSAAAVPTAATATAVATAGPTAASPTPAAAAPAAGTGSAAASARPAGAPFDAKVARSAFRKATAVRDWPHAFEAFFALADHDPKVFHDPVLLPPARDLAAAAAIAGGETGDRVFEALGQKMGSDGPDVLYELVRSRGGSKAAARAKELLDKSEVLARATPEMRITLALREAPCPEKAGLLDRAVAEGDARTVVVMQTVGAACLGRNPALGEAMRALKARLRGK